MPGDPIRSRFIAENLTEEKLAMSVIKPAV
jgi:purine-nucleoside phosphorylase